MKVVFLPSGAEMIAEPGMTIMQALHLAGLNIDAPCGGNGTCKKCKVMITDEDGTREVLACQTKITRDIIVDLPRKDEGHRILMGGITREIAPTPAVKVYTVEVPKPGTSDLRDCWRRLLDSLTAVSGDTVSYRPNLRVISGLYNALEENGYRVDVVVCADEILDVLPVGSPVTGLAFDIGTTTVACYYVDLRSGEEIAQASLLNPQTTYGGDVIMRIKYCVENGQAGPTGDIRKALNQLAAKCASSAKQKMKSIYLITVVGNTTMHHLFLGISPASLAYAPYTPAAAEPMQLDAAEFGFAVNPSAKLYMLPNIAGFVGADTVGAALAASMDEKAEMTLLIDIGTNGEMVMGTRDRLIACSTAAGPAFEGALITCGMRGSEGAIDHVSLQDGKFTYSVIGGGKPIGICGSGLIDLMSELVRTGLVEPAGRLIDADEATEGEAKGHKVEEWKTTVKATCTEGGEKSGVCTRCGEPVTKATNPKGHKAGEKWKTIQEPTSYDRTLIRMKKCERCGEECKRQEKTLSKKEFRSLYKDNCKSISYDKLDRKPDKYDGRKIKFTGYVLQICNEANSYGYGIGNTNQYRVATKGRWNDVIYVYIYGKLDERIREGDKITLWGEYDGLMSYYTGFGVKITIPSMIAEYYSIK